MKKMILIIIILLAISFAGCFFVFNKKTMQVCFSNNCFQVKVANNFVSREIGLMFRKSLDEKNGMLFIFSKEDIYPFWMKNTLIPLDIIWLNKNNEVVFIADNTQPRNTQKITPNKPAIYVLEISAGLTESLEIKIGDIMEIKN